MNEAQADAVANALDGESWQSGGNIWLVIIHRGDGSLVVLSEDAICEYADDDAFDNASALKMIPLHLDSVSTPSADSNG